MSGKTHNPRFAVYLLPGSHTQQQERHCNQAIAERNGRNTAVFQFPDYQALFAAASAEQLDAVIYDSRNVSPDERCFMHLLGEVLWHRYGLGLHHLDAPDTTDTERIFQQLLEWVVDGDSEETGQPFGYSLSDAGIRPDPQQSEQVKQIINSYNRDNSQA